ncbi:shroom isoform X2 [Haematobia irritans]|uniref:shroom isoform X2 n=1 Tax=Haematobia irritans TaxID=7368 RepID=UPI003F50BF1A
MSKLFECLTSIRCNSKASYLPRQSLEKQTSSDPDHGSYKLTLHSNEDLVGTTKSSTYDILGQSTKLPPSPPNNLPDVLPLGVKLQPPSNNSINSQTSLRYGSNNNISSSSSSSQQSSPTQSQAPVNNCYPAYPPSQQRYSTPVLNSFNLNNNSNFSRSQSFDTNTPNHIGTKYMTQSSLDMKKPLAAISMNLETTIEEHPSNMLIESRDSSLQDLQQNSSLSSLSSLSESCASHEERVGGSNNNSSIMSTSSSQNNESSSTAAASSLFRAELVNTTFSGNSMKKSVTRQESLRENIEKITQLQSQLMSAHISESGLMGHGYTSSLSPHTNSNRTSQANVIDIPKTLELQPDTTNPKDYDDDENSAPPTTPPPSASPPPPPMASEAEEEEDQLMIKSSIAYTNNACPPKKSPKESEIVTTSNSTAAEHILSQLDSSTDSLKLVQRSEIILRVNPSTVETASQTDDITDSELKSLTDAGNSQSKDQETTNRSTTLQPRQRLPIEDECEKLSKELATMLQSNDALVQLLCPPGNKTVQDYVSNLYNPNVHQRPSKRDVGTSTLTRTSHHNKNKDEEKITVELKLTEVEIAPDSCDILKSKVDELIKYLNNKVKILSKEQAAIDEESASNDDLGNALLNQLCDKVRPIEESKCRTYIADIGHITGLLLSLSERLARAENQLTAVGDNKAEKKSLENKRDRLLEQLAEAKRLKSDIDRRGVSVKTLLEKNLSADEYADFDYFINMKAKLITDARDIADKIKMGEEIITALSDTLIQSDC